MFHHEIKVVLINEEMTQIDYRRVLVVLQLGEELPVLLDLVHIAFDRDHFHRVNLVVVLHEEDLADGALADLLLFLEVVDRHKARLPFKQINPDSLGDWRELRLKVVALEELVILQLLVSRSWVLFSISEPLEGVKLQQTLDQVLDVIVEVVRQIVFSDLDVLVQLYLTSPHERIITLE